MAGIYSKGGSAGHRYAGWLSEVEAKNFQFGGKVFNGSPSAIYVGSKMVWASYWLKAPAMRAILGAFGQTDGMAVINATNAYLNGIAAQGAAGQAKAQALAGFINEDPMMVCSLGLEPQLTVLPAMPWRVLDNSGSAYIDSGYAFTTNNGQVKIKLIPIQYGGTQQPMGIYLASNNRRTLGMYWGSGSNGTALQAGGTNIIISNPEIGKLLDLDFKAKDGTATYTINGTTATATYTDTIAQPTKTWYLGAINYQSTYQAKMKCACAELYEGGEQVRWFVPWKNNGVWGWINLLTGDFYGSKTSTAFTMSYGYMQNGSWVTWTPSAP